jgi:hypothetical protein
VRLPGGACNDKKEKNMSPQTYQAFVNLNLEAQMRALQNGYVTRFCAFSNALRCVDKRHGTLLNEQVVPVRYGLYGLYVRQNKKCNQLNK